MHTLVTVPDFIAEEIRSVNPGYGRPDVLARTLSSGYLSRADCPLGELIEKGTDIKGYRAVKGRLKKTVSVHNAEGKESYCGPHEGIEGLFRPEDPNRNVTFSMLNPPVVTEPLIAFRDGGEVSVFSTEGRTYHWVESAGGVELPLFGGPFDEVHPFDIFVPLADITLSFSNPGYRYINITRYILGRKGGTWMLNDVMGETAVESPSRDALKNVFAATPASTLPDGRLTFYTLGDD